MATSSKLTQLVKEEITNVLNEKYPSTSTGRWARRRDQTEIYRAGPELATQAALAVAEPLKTKDSPPFKRKVTGLENIEDLERETTEYKKARQTDIRKQLYKLRERAISRLLAQHPNWPIDWIKTKARAIAEVELQEWFEYYDA